MTLFVTSFVLVQTGQFIIQTFLTSTIKFWPEAVSQENSILNSPIPIALVLFIENQTAFSNESQNYSLLKLSEQKGICASAFLMDYLFY